MDPGFKLVNIVQISSLIIISIYAFKSLHYVILLFLRGLSPFQYSSLCCLEYIYAGSDFLCPCCGCRITSLSLMDSLLASYASSDDEEEQQHRQDSLSEFVPKSAQTSHTLLSLPQPKSASSPFSSLPEPTASSIFSSLPPPNSSPVFSSLPPPISVSNADPKPKRIVQFRPPIMLKPPIDEDDDEEEEEKKIKSSQEVASPSGSSSLSSFFSSLPAPKNTLGSGSAPVLGAGRRSVVQTNAPTSNYDGNALENSRVAINEGQENYAGNWGDESSFSTSEPPTTETDPSIWTPNDANYGNYQYYEDSGSNVNYEVNHGNYDGTSAMLAPENAAFVDIVAKMPGKRGRREIPAEIVEVKQDELMKNRPREHQIKSTGIAFGPSYQSVASSTKGKPSKLHKRKHQIGTLYFDMKKNEHELADRRSKGFLTKAETQAKYGW